MSDLQLGLLATGVAVVVGVIAYNRWQESGVRRRTEDAFAPRHGRGPARCVLDNAASRRGHWACARTPAASAHIDRAIDHTLVAEDTPPPAPRDAAAEALGRCRTRCGRGLHRRARLRTAGHRRGAGSACAGPLGRGADQPCALGRLRRIARTLASSRPRQPLPAIAGGRPAHEPRRPAERGRSRRRSCGEVQELALAIAAQADFPDLAEAAARAQDLDRFCAAVDVQIGLSVIGSESHAFPGTKVRVLAESAGMAIGRDGRFHRHAEDGSELFSLANLEPMPFHAETIKTLQTRGVTALFDVPRVARERIRVPPLHRLRPPARARARRRAGRRQPQADRPGGARGDRPAARAHPPHDGRARDPGRRAARAAVLLIDGRRGSSRQRARRRCAPRSRTRTTATTCSTRRRSATPSTTACSASCRRSRPRIPSSSRPTRRRSASARAPRRGVRDRPHRVPMLSLNNAFDDARGRGVRPARARSARRRARSSTAASRSSTGSRSACATSTALLVQGATRGDGAPART